MGNYKKITMKHFTTEIREAFNKKYLKVFLKDLNHLEKVQTLLSNLQSVKNVNITANATRDITVYPAKVYDVNEMKTEVELALNNYFSSSPIDPVFVDEGISSISEQGYADIINRINQYGQNLEKYKGLYDKFDEEGFRDFFLPHLNSISKRHTATGETFNKIGKTDILIQNENGNNVFIGECKIWHGKSELSKALDQLLERYVTWRDEKVALIVFNKENVNFTEVIDKAVEAVKEHRQCISYDGKRSNTSHSFTFNHPEDSNKKVKLELILFNCK